VGARQRPDGQRQPALLREGRRRPRERAPGDVYIVGSDWIQPTVTWGAAAWRSVDGAPWQRLLPDPPDTWDPTTYWFGNAGTVAGNVYAVASGSPWVHDGVSWIAHGPDMGWFLKPVSFADHLVFQAVGKLFRFDGVKVEDAGLAVFGEGLQEVAEGHLLAVDASHHVQASTDLVSWECLGEAPEDVASIGALDGVIYFGGTGARIYRYPDPSW
jgi:hypothetical protein